MPKLRIMKKFFSNMVGAIVALGTILAVIMVFVDGKTVDKYIPNWLQVIAFISIGSVILLCLRVWRFGVPSEEKRSSSPSSKNDDDDSPEDEEYDEFEAKLDIAFTAGKFWQVELTDAVSRVMTELQKENFFNKLEDKANLLGIKYHGFVVGDDEEGSDEYSERSLEESADICYRDGKLFKEALVEFFSERFGAEEVADKMIELKKKAFKQGIFLIDYV